MKDAKDMWDAEEKGKLDRQKAYEEYEEKIRVFKFIKKDYLFN